MNQMIGNLLEGEMADCVENCANCHMICVSTIQHCLQVGGRHSEQPHIRLLADCAQICQTTADFMLRSSDLHDRTCAVCAEVCERCAQDCERLADDDIMRRCADLCHRCAESCRHLAGAMAH